MVVDVISQVGIVLVGLAGILATFKSGRREQDTALALAREERAQQRLESAYRDLLKMVGQGTSWAMSVFPVLTSSPDQYVMPPYPQMGEQAEAMALSAYFSADVRRLIDSWNDTMNAVQTSGISITIGRQAREQDPSYRGINVEQHTIDLLDQKQAVKDAEAALRDQVHDELMLPASIGRARRSRSPRFGRPS